MRHTTAIFSAVAMLLAVAATPIASTPATTRKVVISAADAKGAAVADLAAGDITVKEGGKAYPVESVQPATSPMQVTLIVDDGGTGAFQGAVGQFIQKTFGKGQFRIVLLAPHATELVDFTDNGDALRGALAKMGARARMKSTADQLLTSISEAAKMLQSKKAERGHIVVMTLTAGQPTEIDAKTVLSTLRASGAMLNVLHGTGADLGETLLDGPKQTGGRIEEAKTGAAIVPAALNLADMLLHQYVVTYNLPDGVKMSDKLQVDAVRKGITITAPTRISDK